MKNLDTGGINLTQFNWYCQLVSVEKRLNLVFDTEFVDELKVHQTVAIYF